jgi:adenylate cyclase
MTGLRLIAARFEGEGSSVLNRLRLWSALVLGIFVLLHLMNLSVLLVSGRLADLGFAISILPWRTVPGTVLLAGAFAVHLSLGLRGIYMRKTLRLQGWEISQNILGLLIPLLLIYHLIGTRFAYEIWDVGGDYTSQLLLFWFLEPAWCAGQILLLLAVWVHAYIGFNSWIQLRPWYPTYKPLISSSFIVVPTLALAGFVSGGLQIRALAEEEGAVPEIREWRAEWGMTETVHDSVLHYTLICMVGYVGLIASTLLVRQARLSMVSRSRGSKVLYNGKIALTVFPRDTLLEAIRAAGVQHASVCGGKGRCSTCRVRVTRGLELLEPASRAEKEVLARISAPPSVRLACQLRPAADLEVLSLLAPSVGPEAATSNPALGEEMEVVVLFCDLRRFSQLAERMLPYDVVFILNRFFEAMGLAVTESGGQIDKFIGDGLMALFGIESGPSRGCGQALSAACLMANKLEDLNRTLASELERPLQVGIGIELGRAIVGEMGHGDSKSLTAIGTCVNTASRFQELCKEFDCQAIVSVDAASRGDWDLSRFRRREVRVRGQTRAREVHIIRSARDLQLVRADASQFSYPGGSP